MAKGKRRPDGEDSTGLDDVHASRKKRIKYTEDDAQLANIYNELADEVQSVRIKAAGQLVQSLSKESPEQAQRLRTAETRLIKGLCSARKAARLGFSIALAEVFRLKFNRKHVQAEGVHGLVKTADSVVELTTPVGNVSGQEKRDHYLGRRYAFQALLRSDIGLDKWLSEAEWQAFTGRIFELASLKQWLRRECCSMLHDYLVSDAASILDNARVRVVINELINKNLAKTSDGVGLWLTVQRRYPQLKLPKRIWHHNDPLTSRELPLLSKLLLEIDSDSDDPATKKAGSRQSNLSFAWQVILSELFERGNRDKLQKFWESAVVSTMFSSSSSAERKSLGLQVVTLAISTAPSTLLVELTSSRNIWKAIIDQRASPERYLFEAAKVPCDALVSRVKRDPECLELVVRSLISCGNGNFDQLTRTKTLESVVSEADASALKSIVNTLRTRFEQPEVEANNVESHRRIIADILVNMIRMHRRDDVLWHDYYLRSWALALLEAMVVFCYGTTPLNVAISETNRSMCQDRLMSCLGCILDNPIDRAVNGCLRVVNVVASDCVKQDPLDQAEESRTVNTATSLMHSAVNVIKAESVAHAFQLLLSLCIIQVYNKEPDSLEALKDLMFSYNEFADNKGSSTTLIELLLSFVSKPSGLFRKLAEQVFSVLADQLTAESLESLTDVLGQQESLQGQQALFETHDEEDADAYGPELNEEGEIDVEDASDVELVNGDKVSASSSALEDGTDSNSSSEAEEGATTAEQEEVAAFDKKLADALGTVGMKDSDDDGSDMDDEQMMALEPQLATIFKARQKLTGHKQESKDAKESIVNFKNRVLDLLMIYVKAQYANILALDLILPLTVLVRSTTSKPTGEKAFSVLKQYFESCSKNKSLPQPDDHEACFEVLASVHEEMELGGSKIHANACSRASLFLSKVLVALHADHYQRIARMYAGLQSKWYTDEKSKVPGSVFTEWISWSINTRKHV